MKKLIRDYFTEESRDIYDALKPTYLLTKMLGYAPQTYKRSKKRLTKSGIFYAVCLITVKCLLICMSFDPNKFANATNSNILNYGVWLQTEISLAMSLYFLLLALTKISEKWLMLEKFYEIDEVLQKEFFVHLHYMEHKIWLLGWVCSGILIALAMFGLTIYFMIDLPFGSLHKACVCFSIYISNICILSTGNDFNSSCSFVFMRFHIVNNILRQLDDSHLDHSIIDGSTSKELSYTNYRRMNIIEVKKSKISSICMSEWMEQRKSNLSSDQKPHNRIHLISFMDLVTKVFISKETFYKSAETSYVLEKITKLISLHEKLTDSVILVNKLFSLEMALILLLIFVYSLFGLFGRFTVYMDFQVEAFKISSLSICWMQCYTVLTFVIITFSTLVTKRAKQTAIIVHRIIRKINDQRVQNKLFRFSKMLYSRRVTVQFGLISFDWPFFLTITGAMASYFIILIQFQLSIKSNNA